MFNRKVETHNAGLVIFCVLSTQLPFNGTLSVISFSKTKENKNTVLIQYH